MEVIPPRLQKDVRMMAGNGNFVDLKRVVRKPSEGGPLLAEGRALDLNEHRSTVSPYLVKQP